MPRSITRYRTMVSTGGRGENNCCCNIIMARGWLDWGWRGEGRRVADRMLAQLAALWETCFLSAWPGFFTIYNSSKFHPFYILFCTFVRHLFSLMNVQPVMKKNPPTFYFLKLRLPSNEQKASKWRYKKTNKLD